MYCVTDIIDEIQQDIKEERFVKLWREYGSYVIGLAVMVVLVTAGTVWWQNAVSAKSEAQGSKLFAALIQSQEGNVAEALSTYAGLTEEGMPVAASIAGLRQASLLLQENKIEEALALYDRLSKSKDAPDEMKELADLLYVNTVINATSLNKDEEVEKRLKYLARQGAPWHYSALEISAFYALGKGEKERAGELFESLAKEEAAPVRIRNRASEMINAINS